MFRPGITQEEVTEFQVTGGMQRYNKKKTTENALLQPAPSRLLKLLLNPSEEQQLNLGDSDKTLEQGIRDALKPSNKPGPNPRFYHLLSAVPDLDPAVLALLTARVAIERCMRNTDSRQGITSIAIAVGRAVYDEIKMGWLKEDDPVAYKDLIERVSELTSVSMMASEERAALRLAGLPALWAKRDIVVVGLTLLELMITHTGLIEKTSYRRGSSKHTAYCIVLTRAAILWLREADRG